jgi:hypothetical protein
MREVALFVCAGCLMVASWVLRDDSMSCPEPSPRSVEALFAPCQAAGAGRSTFAHVVSKTSGPTIAQLR